jgi:GntR family transcriptional regulator
LTPAEKNCINELIQVVEAIPPPLLGSETVQIHISPADGVPIYLQIVNQIKYLVACGRLSTGEELPPIRVLAERLLINPNTVARAYRELEQAGVVEKRRTAGTYVTDQRSPLARRERVRILSERIDALLAEARQMDFDLEEVVELIRQREAAMQPASTGAAT